MERTFLIKKQGEMKILLTGGTGLLGHGLLRTRPAQIHVTSLYQRPNEEYEKEENQLQLDIRNKGEMETLFRINHFDLVIHAAGIASVDYVKSNYAESLESNIVGTLNISSLCRRKNIPMVYISSNAVFDGEKAPYDEEAAPGPVNEYGEIKLECENLIRRTLVQYLIVRPILMYGWNRPGGRKNPVTWMLDELRSKKPIHMVNDVFENPIYNLDCAEAIWRLVEKGTLGTIHLAGPERLNRYEFACTVADVFQLDRGLITPVSSNYFRHLAKRPRDTSFDIRKSEKEISFRPRGLRQGLEDMRASAPA